MKATIINFNDVNTHRLAYEFYLRNSGDTNSESRAATVKYLKSCIEHGLTEQQKICITMVVLQNQKQKDVANALGLSASTVSRHVNAAKRKLKKYSEFLGK